MVGENDPATIDADALVTFKYRNFDDYSIWEYTAEMFAAIDQDADSAIDLVEFIKFHGKQDKFFKEITQSDFDRAYYLLTVDDSNLVYTTALEREHWDINFDGFIDWSEFVLATAETNYYYAKANLGYVAVADLKADLSWTDARIDLLQAYDPAKYTEAGASYVALDSLRIGFIADHIWDAIIENEGDADMTLPDLFDENLFKYFDQDLSGTVTKDEYYIAQTNSIEFYYYVLDADTGSFDFPIEDMELTRLENKWIDLNADDLIDQHEW